MISDGYLLTRDGKGWCGKIGHLDLGDGLTVLALGKADDLSWSFLWQKRRCVLQVGLWWKAWDCSIEDFWSVDAQLVIETVWSLVQSGVDEFRGLCG